MFKWVLWACLGLCLCAGGRAQAAVPATLVNDTDRIWHLLQNRLSGPLALDITEPGGSRAVHEAGWCAIRRTAAPEHGKNHGKGPSASKRARLEDVSETSSSTRPCGC
jgi:hypothetical protein